MLAVMTAPPADNRSLVRWRFDFRVREHGGDGRTILILELAWVGTDRDEPRMRAVVSGAPDSRIILDANEGWTAENLERHLVLAAELGIALIEQPLKAGADAMLREVLTRMKDFELAAPVEWLPSNFISGPKAMPVRFRAA